MSMTATLRRPDHAVHGGRASPALGLSRLPAGPGRATIGSMSEIDDLVPGFVPETELERDLIADADLRAGLSWGLPRAGHPEGSVGHHVAAMLAWIGADDPLR